MSMHLAAASVRKYLMCTRVFTYVIASDHIPIGKVYRFLHTFKVKLKLKL